MKTFVAFLLFMSATLMLIILNKPGSTTSPTISGNNNLEPRTIEWTDLLPKEALKFIQPANIVDHSNLSKFELEKDKNAKRIPSNSIGKNFGVIMQNTPNDFDDSKKMTLKDVLISTGVRRELSNIKIKIAGYVVPLEYNDNHELTAFFFAPYFGACTHVPPPSPNQLIYVKSPQGFKIKEIFDPFWLVGILHIETTETEETVLGISSYSLNAESIVEYKND